MNLFDTSDPRPIHLMGVAGAGMRALALVARGRGVPVTGCDVSPDPGPDLAASGVAMTVGHAPEHVDGARALVVTAAIPAGHPEIARAHALGIPVVKRSEALAALVASGRVVGVAGTHGKTTTTVLTTEALCAAGLDATGLAGGFVERWHGNARVGRDQVYVVEADEYDRSFLTLNPTVAIVTNVEPDHLECYGNNLEELEAAFHTFVERASHRVVGIDDPGGRRLAEGLEGPLWRVTVQDDVEAEVRARVLTAEPGRTEVDLSLPDTRVHFSLQVPGTHNVFNASCALAAAAALGEDPHVAATGVASFSGVGRRFERVGTVSGVDIVDDYAHHPTELRATLRAARQVFGRRRLVAVFQPHLYSRTRDHGQALGEALTLADVSLVAPIYPAREAPIPGVSGSRVAEAAQNAGADAVYVEDRAQVVPWLLDTVRADDVVITLGAGDVTDVARDLMARLVEREGACN